MTNLTIDTSFFAKYNIPGPRYTSYPPAPYFKEDFDPRQWELQLSQLNAEDKSLSFYFHVPFCPRRCRYCGCTTETGVGVPVMDRYYQALLKEMDMVLEKLDAPKRIKQIHFGGGTPNFFHINKIQILLQKLTTKFQLTNEAEVAMECDPNLLKLPQLKQLYDIGFTRLSFGLQDFNIDVLRASGRSFPTIHPKDLIKEGRRQGFKGLNLDLIYGLARQTPASFKETLHQTIEADPDRIAVFGYAHVPWQMPHQKALEKYGLPTTDERLEMAVSAHNILTSAGYTAIGMDHYAKPSDDLAKALSEGSLHRNFQGYCTKKTTGEVVAFGASGISQLSSGYAQNIKSSPAYADCIDKGKLPLHRLYILSQEDRFFKDVINSLMCAGRLSPVRLSDKHKIPLKEVQKKIQPGLEKMAPFVEDGLVSVHNNEVHVTRQGWLVVRCIAMAFDPLLKEKKGQYSKTV